MMTTTLGNVCIGQPIIFQGKIYLPLNACGTEVFCIPLEKCLPININTLVQIPTKYQIESEVKYEN